MSEMQNYFVLYEYPDTTIGDEPLAMRFMADDSAHAEEQALDAEPTANILWVSTADTFESALTDYYYASLSDSE